MTRRNPLAMMAATLLFAPALASATNFPPCLSPAPAHR